MAPPETPAPATRAVAVANGHAARLVTTLPLTQPAEAESVLRKLGLKHPKALMLLSGAAANLDENVRPRLAQLFSRGIARAAMKTMFTLAAALAEKEGSPRIPIFVIQAGGGTRAMQETLAELQEKQAREYKGAVRLPDGASPEALPSRASEARGKGSAGAEPEAT